MCDARLTFSQTALNDKDAAAAHAGHKLPRPQTARTWPRDSRLSPKWRLKHPDTRRGSGLSPRSLRRIPNNTKQKRHGGVRGWRWALTNLNRKAQSAAHARRTHGAPLSWSSARSIYHGLQTVRQQRTPEQYISDLSTQRSQRNVGKKSDVTKETTT